jgi:hypothetical protein
LEQGKEIEVSIILPQVGEECALELDHNILHLLSGQRVAIFEAAA